MLFLMEDHFYFYFFLQKSCLSSFTSRRIPATTGASHLPAVDCILMSKMAPFDREIGKLAFAKL